MTIPQKTIRAASEDDFRRNDLTTAYVDLGFGGDATKSNSIRLVRSSRDIASLCRPPTSLSFGELRGFLRSLVTGSEPDFDGLSEIMLVLEGPLSFRFRNGCPVARGVDGLFGPAFSWHLQPPNAARQAAQFVVEDLFDSQVACSLGTDIYLAEGFVSGKGRKHEASHEAFRRAKDALQSEVAVNKMPFPEDPHLLDAALLQLIHAGKIGEIFMSDHPLLKGCESILGRVSGERSLLPPPVLSLLPEETRS